MKKLIAILMSLLIFTACGTSEESGATSTVEKNHIVIKIAQDPDFLDPHKDVAAATGEILFNVFEGLVKINSKGELKPALAENYSVSDDGLTYEFTIKKGVKFHNGEELTPESVKASYERFMPKDFSRKPICEEFISFIDSISVSGDKVIFKLKELSGSAVGLFTINVVKEDKESGEIYGTGPYIIKEYLPGEHVLLVKNENYWNIGNVGNIDEAEYRIIKDDQSGIMSFQMGEVDIIPRMNAEYLSMVESSGKMIKGEQNLVQLLAINNSVKPFDDIRVRQALNYAVDRQEVINGATLGEGTIAEGPISPAVKSAYNKETENVYTYDLEKAKELLKEAGYPNGFEVTLKLPASYEIHKNAGQIIKEQLAKVGITANIEEVEWGTWLTEVYNQKNYELTVIGFEGEIPPYRTVERYTTGNHRNMCMFKSDAYDEVIKKAIRETDEDKKNELYKEAQMILTKGAAAVFIQAPNYIAAVNEKIEGFEIYPVYVLDISLMNYRK